MVEYLLGEFDFYKVISIDSKRITQIQSYNLHGNLNKSTRTINPKIKIPVVMLPTRIVSFDFKPNSSNTVELYMDGGWQFNFRIHNASTKVEQSLKFDIQIIGMPTWAEHWSQFPTSPTVSGSESVRETTASTM